MLTFAGCADINESFTDGYSENPNQATDAPIENVFTGSQSAMIVFMEGHTARLANMWTQHATGDDRQYSGYNSYTVSGTGLTFGNSWETAYTDVLSNIRLAEQKAQETEGFDNMIAVAQIMEAATIGTVTALWGDVPYSDAFQGEENLNPEIDAQEDIYQEVQELLDEAINTLESNPQDLASGVDIYSYEGNAENWIKAGYTLKARFYMHVGDTEAAITAAEDGIQAIDGSEDLKFLHGTTYEGNMNLWYSFMVNDRNGYLTASENHAYPLMEDREDAQTDESGRMAFYYNEDGDDLNTNEAFAEAAEFPLLTAAETYLILAEAHEAENNPGEAVDYLNDAREYNENKYDGSIYNPYSETDFASDEELQQEIYDETYLSLISQIETFNFARRIDFQITGLEPVSGQDRFPERFLYPNVEQNANENFPDQSSEDLFTPTSVNQ